MTDTVCPSTLIGVFSLSGDLSITIEFSLSKSRLSSSFEFQSSNNFEIELQGNFET